MTPTPASIAATIERRHPRDCGFRLGLTATISRDGQIESAMWEPDARTLRDLVYVALRSDGAALKIGATRGTLHGRWSGILKLIAAERGQRQYRENEWADRDRWRTYAKGSTFEVWFKLAEQVALRYLDGQTKIDSMRHVEEDYIDAHFRPLIGTMLETRKRETRFSPRASRRTGSNAQ